MAIAQISAAPAAALTPQTISFALPVSEVVGSSIDLTATATSGLPVSFASNTPSTCTVTNDVLTLVAVGVCTVTASQPGDGTWDPAPSVQDSMTVDPAPPPPSDPQPQTIAFTLPASGYVGSTVPLTATASSGLDVSYTVDTPTICSADSTTLALNAVGECTLTASQAGSEDWLPAPDVARSITVDLSPIVTADGANLGRVALNGPVQSAVIDPDTGITYVGGTFSEIGVRTGSVALVHPPDSGNDTLKSDSPDVLGTELTVFAHDDSGFFVGGHIDSVNGDGIKRDVVTRMTVSGAVDTSWALQTTCGTTSIPNWARSSVRWDLGGVLVSDIGMAPTTAGDSTVGLAFIDKASGIARRVGAGNATCGAGGRLWAATSVFAPLAACAGWAVCLGHVVDLVEDPGSNSLITAVSVVRGVSLANQERRQTWLVAYDMTTGARRWAIRLESISAPEGFPSGADWGATVTHIAGLGGSVLISGRFPLEPVNRPIPEFTTTMLIDAASGAILQRWNRQGEQDVADPVADEIAVATACTPVQDATTSPEHWRFVPRSASHSVGYGLATGGSASGYPVCEYSVTGTGLAARLSAVSLGTLPAPLSPDELLPLPSSLYADHILVGPFGAFDLENGNTFPGWRPAPSSGSVRTVMAGATVVTVGASTFMRGEPAYRVAAVDRDLAPVDGFRSGLLQSSSDNWFRSMALNGDQLILVGRFHGAEGVSHIVALDKVTGAIDWMAPSSPTTYAWGLAVDPGSRAFYVGFESTTGSFIKRFVPSGNGFVVDTSFEPTLTPLGGAGPFVTALAWIGGRLYVGGQFASVDGQPRQGLARFGVNGLLDGWAPQIVTEMAVPAGSTIELSPIDFQEIAGSVVVTGRFNYLTPIPGGGGYYLLGPPGVRVYSSSTGALVRPLDGKSWFGDTDGESAYDSALSDGILYVGFGGNGIAAFDATTFEYLPYLSRRTSRSLGQVIYAIAIRPAGSSAADARSSAAASTPSIVLAGVVPSWSNRSAGNVLEVGPGTLNSDRTRPVVSAVRNRPRSSGTFSGSAAPWTIAWTGKDTGSGIVRYELARSRNGGAWTTVSVDLRSASAGVLVSPGSTYRFRVRGIDRAGNIGSWAYGSTFKVTAYQQSSTRVRYGGRWSTSTSTTWWGGSARSSSTKGSTASLTFTGRSIGWVGLKAPTRGKAYVYINGVLKATIDLKASSTLKQRVVWSTAYSTSATRTITVKVLGTSGRPRVDIDGFLVGS